MKRETFLIDESEGQRLMTVARDAIVAPDDTIDWSPSTVEILPVKQALNEGLERVRRDRARGIRP